MAKKGAFQLSLGLIVIVVFAVLLLSLSISWLTGLIGTIEELTYKTTDVAQKRLLDQLAQDGNRVGIASPPITKWNRGESGSFALGIRNEEVDSPNNYFVNVYLEDVSDNLLPFNQAIQNTANSWISGSTSTDISPGGSETVDVIIAPPTNAKPGLYSFRAAVCKEFESGNCHATFPPTYTDPSLSFYGGALFTIEIV